LASSPLFGNFISDGRRCGSNPPNKTNTRPLAVIKLKNLSIMKLRCLLIILLLPIKAFNQTDCDSSSFKQLLDFSEYKTISDTDFNNCCIITEYLLRNKCTKFIKEIKGTSYCIATLTSTFGKICINANSLNSVKEYFKYYKLKNGTYDEELEFTLERVFVKRPADFMNEFAKNDSVTRKRMIIGLAWGFVNNRRNAFHYLGDNPTKAMIVKNIPKKTVLDTSNYKSLYFSLNPQIIELYPMHKNDLDEVLKTIYTFLWVDSVLKEKN